MVFQLENLLYNAINIFGVSKKGQEGALRVPDGRSAAKM